MKFTKIEVGKSANLELNYDEIQLINEAFHSLIYSDDGIAMNSAQFQLNVKCAALNWNILFDLIKYGYVSGFQKEQISNYIDNKQKTGLKDNDLY